VAPRAAHTCSCLVPVLNPCSTANATRQVVEWLPPCHPQHCKHCEHCQYCAHYEGRHAGEYWQLSGRSDGAAVVGGVAASRQGSEHVGYMRCIRVVRLPVWRRCLSRRCQQAAAEGPAAAAAPIPDSTACGSSSGGGDTLQRGLQRGGSRLATATSAAFQVEQLRNAIRCWLCEEGVGAAALELPLCCHHFCPWCLTPPPAACTGLSAVRPQRCRVVINPLRVHRLYSLHRRFLQQPAGHALHSGMYCSTRAAYVLLHTGNVRCQQHAMSR
jgi:hypothetical protein